MSPEGPKHEDLVPDGKEVRSAGDIEQPVRKQNRLLQSQENNFSSNCAELEQLESCTLPRSYPCAFGTGRDLLAVPARNSQKTPY